jgi:hypothetical protein
MVKKLVLGTVAIAAGAFGAWTLTKHGITFRQPDFWFLSGSAILSTLAGDRALKRKPKA